MCGWLRMRFELARTFEMYIILGGIVRRKSCNEPQNF